MLLRVPSSGISASRFAAARGDDLGFAGQGRLGGDELLDLDVDGFEMAIEHIQVGLMLPFEQGITEMIAPGVERCGPG